MFYTIMCIEQQTIIQNAIKEGLLAVCNTRWQKKKNQQPTKSDNKLKHKAKQSMKLINY